MSTPAANPSKAPLVLLGLMSLVTFTGPFAIFLVIRGGKSAVWPPDRPVEWWIFGVVTLAVVAMMIGCVTAGRWSRQRQ
jgi:hypothetical protein